MIRMLHCLLYFCVVLLGALGEGRAADPAAAISIQKDVVYGVGQTEAGDKELLLDLYRPSSPAGPLPVLIYMHGGRWENGSKDWLPRQISTMEWFAERGYAAIAFNYRLRGDDPIIAPASADWRAILADHFADDEEISELVPLMTVALEDIARLVGWVAEHAEDFGFDTSRIILSGGSAGAVTTLIAAYAPVDIFGNLPKPAAVVSFAGGLFGLEAKIPDDRSVPALFVHGTADQRIDFAESMRARDALAARGVESEVIALEGLRHSLGYPTLLQETPTDNGQSLLERVHVWLQRILGG